MKFTEKNSKTHPVTTAIPEEVDLFEGIANLDQYQEQMPPHVTPHARHVHVSCDPCDGCDCGATD